MGTAEVYELTRSRLLVLGRDLGAEAALRAVPALPGWTVKDAFAHLCGLCADVLDGRMDGAGSPTSRTDGRPAAGAPTRTPQCGVPG